MRDCKELKPDFTSFRCGQVGYISRRCPPPQGNEYRGAIVPVTTPFGSETLLESLLPQIVVNWKRVKALVDTGCMTTLVTTGFKDTWSGSSTIRVVND